MTVMSTSQQCASPHVDKSHIALGPAEPKSQRSAHKHAQTKGDTGISTGIYKPYMEPECCTGDKCYYCVINCTFLTVSKKREKRSHYESHL